MATISTRTFQEFEQSFDDVRDNYSGRGMYGTECFAIVFDEGAWELRGVIEDMLEFLNDVDEECADEVRTVLKRAPREDSMGTSCVYYWPNIQVEED